MKMIDNILDVEQYLDGIEGVIFDLDDTLYSEKDYVRSGYKSIAYYFPQVENMADKLWEVFEQGGKPIDEVFAAEGLLSYKDEALRIYRFHEPEITLYPGVKEMLLRLHLHGKKLGIITDGRLEGQKAKLDALGLRTQIDEIIITDEFGGIEYRKPNPIAFLEMQRRLDVPFEKMCYIGDNPKKDFIAPQMLGMMSYYFKNERGLYSE